jgi:hypothetical protein
MLTSLSENITFCKTSRVTSYLAMQLSQTESFLTAGDVIVGQQLILEEMLDGLFYGMWS